MKKNIQLDITKIVLNESTHLQRKKLIKKVIDNMTEMERKLFIKEILEDNIEKELKSENRHHIIYSLIQLTENL